MGGTLRGDTFSRFTNKVAVPKTPSTLTTSIADPARGICECICVKCSTKLRFGAAGARRNVGARYVDNGKEILGIFSTLLLSAIFIILGHAEVFPEVEWGTERIVVLTFDDAVKSHRTFVGPFLKKLGFGATFFVTQCWMNDSENFMTWKEIAEIHEMGFEIGNHSWTHADFSQPSNASRLSEELKQVETELERVGVTRPISFAHCGNSFGPEAIDALKKQGYLLARRGMQPEVAYGQIQIGPTFDPLKHHPLLIPTSGDAYPGWTLEHFRRVVDRAGNGQIVVLQFHWVPDLQHPWVNTSPELFKRLMNYLKERKFRVVALRDIEPLLPKTPPADPLLRARYPPVKGASVINCWWTSCSSFAWYSLRLNLRPAVPSSRKAHQP
jgi:peptidoglycan/xylan/chitin deacetylase (PgdA/CDA1 family)